MPDFRFDAPGWAAVATVTATTDQSIKTAAAGQRHFVQAVQLQNAGAAATVFTIKDGTTVIWQVSLPASMAQPIGFTFPTPLRTSVNAALGINTATASTVVANLQGFTSA